MALGHADASTSAWAHQAIVPWAVGAFAAAAVLAAQPAVAEVAGPSAILHSTTSATATAPEYSTAGPELFDPMRYLGRWYEVASEKRGFAGEGQRDCHCTQGRR